MARARLARFSERVCLILGGDGDLDFPESSFDRVVALHSFQFWPAPADSAPRLRKLLRPSGWLVIVLRNHERSAQAWLPNPLSRTPGEAEAALALLSANGFAARQERRRRMVGLVGEAV